ncbi:MAG: 50S ribosomal protein L10 [Synergistales bacterium]|nr:50S ribosomal protein L10 [Synergistales bacterium]
MPKADRVQKVQELKEMIANSKAVYIVEYRGLNVDKMTEVRAKVREAGGEMKVAKNTLFTIALGEQDLPVPEDAHSGANAYTLAYDDVASVAKALRDFARTKGNEALLIKAGVLDGNLLDVNQVLALADLPSREELLGQVARGIAGPISGFLNVLSGPSRGLVTCLSQIKEQKEKEEAA